MKEKLQGESGQRRTVGSIGVSAIVFNSGAEGSIQKTLTTLHKQTFTDFETIIVNQSLDDDGLKSLIKDWPQTVVMRSEGGIGFGRACNLAAQSALGKYLLFLDTNAWLNETAVNELVEALESEPGAGIAGPLILNANGSLQSIGMNINQFGRPRANRVPFEADTELIDNVFFVPGSVLMIEKQLFNSLNGFDELYVRGLEDADLCWRARLLGKKIVVNPWSIAYFDPGENRDGDSYLRHRNSLRMIIKNYGACKALSGGANFVRGTVVKSFTSLLYLKPGVFYQYWRALFWNLAILPDSMRQRRRVQRRRRLNDKSVLKHILIDDEKNSDFTSDRAA
ncbi:MAG: glycosyltransferase [Actinomycetota bacterium]|nr:glycosyltransferase [Actinomycetota bacterium]